MTAPRKKPKKPKRRVTPYLTAEQKARQQAALKAMRVQEARDIQDEAIALAERVETLVKFLDEQVVGDAGRIQYLTDYVVEPLKGVAMACDDLIEDLE